MRTPANATDSATYTDLNRLSQLKTGDRDSDANVRKVAQEFEAVFLNQMLKSMRAASDVMADKDSPFNSQASLQYRDLHDQQLAVTLSRQGNGIGLANVLTRQLSQRQAKTVAPAEEITAASTVTEKSADNLKSLGSASLVGRDDSRMLARRRLSIPSREAVQRALAANQPTAPSSAKAVVDKPSQFSDKVARLLEKGLKVQPLDHFSETSTARRSTSAGETWQARMASLATGIAPIAARTQGAAVEVKTQDSLVDDRFESRQDFIATLLPMAEKAAQRLGVEPEFLVAQAALETGWGKSMIRTADGSNSYNLFGIKSAAWDGPSAQVTTTEYVNGKATKEVAGFRVYDSFEHSFNDYARLLQGNSRYQNALKVADTEGGSERFMQELQRAGYATDPDYARKVIQIAHRVQQTYQITADADVAARNRG